MYSLLVLALLSTCHSTSISYHYEDIVTKSKVELSPVQISCSLNDILVLATPVVNCQDVLYYLHRPNGEVIRIDRAKNFSKPKSKLFKFYNTNSVEDDLSNNFNNSPLSKVIVKYINKDIKTVYPKRMYKILKVGHKIQKAEKQINRNDFMIGPLHEEDHGNWVLSIYCKDLDGEWIEMFQVITIKVVTSVAMENPKVMLREGSTFNLSFKYPIKGLETCELTVPWGSPDRYFDRNRIELDRCGYVVTNVTKRDHGTWRVIGVGRIVYVGTVALHVVDDKTPEYDLLSYEEYLQKNKSYNKYKYN